MELKAYIENRLQKIIKYAGKERKDIRGIHVDLSCFLRHKPEQRVRVEVNIDLYQGQRLLRAVAKAEDVQKGINLVGKKLKRQIESVYLK